jgi:membrane peptidoglycan carboxypeptidase
MSARRAGWAGLVVGGILAGLLVGVVALPVGVLAGLGTQFVARAFAALPADLATPRTPQTSYLYAADGTTLVTTFSTENRTDVPLSAIAPAMRQAIVAAEDARFYRHGAVDLRGVLRALVADSGSGTAEQGASTLTMQYVRNVRKNDPAVGAAATADTLTRKVQEVRYATALERTLGKDQILDRYLNIVYFGAGAYGVDAAARTYFSTTPDRLTVAQSALLAGLVQAPDADNPLGGDRAAALARRSYVLTAMVRAGTLDAPTAARTAAAPIGLAPTTQPDGCPDFFCDYLVQWWQQQPEFGATPAARLTALREGGYRIVESVDPGVQATATSAATAVYGYHSSKVLPIAAVRPGTGRVLALAVNRHYGLGAHETTNQLVAGGGSVTGYQAGSTFKLFTMLAALEAGYPLDTSFDAPAQLCTGYGGGSYCPVNDNPSWMDGDRTMWTGFGRSVNTYFVWLEQKVGAARAVAMAERLGITFRATSDTRMAADSAASWGSFTLGVSDTTPLDLAAAYATVAADGVYCAPLPVTAITGPDGRPSPAASPDCRRAVAADVARAAVDAARCPIGQAGAYGRCDGGTAAQVSDLLDDRPVGGKTGSSEGNATESFVGFTPQAAVAGIAADPTRPADGVGSAVQTQVVAAVALVLGRAVRGQPAVDFPPPDRDHAFGGGSLLPG